VLRFISTIVGGSPSSSWTGVFFLWDADWFLSEIAGFPIEFSETQITFLIDDFPQMGPHGWFTNWHDRQHGVDL
jgi:hypothetical protein